MFKSQSALREALMKVKNPRPQLLKKGVVYEVPCMDYIGETGKTLQKRLVEHKAAVRRGDTNNGIAVHAWDHQHRVDWESASVMKQEPGYWKRRVATRGPLRSRDMLRTQPQLWVDIEPYLDSVSGMTCTSTCSPPCQCSLSHHYHIKPCQPICLCHYLCVTIYSCVSVPIVITAEESPRTETFCNNCCQPAMIS